MSLDRFLRLGETITLGTHTFTADEIIAFGRQFDPQPFHTDAEAARDSVFGRLCASGWHTCAMWMRYNLTGSKRVRSARGKDPARNPNSALRPAFPI